MKELDWGVIIGIAIAVVALVAYLYAEWDQFKPAIAALTTLLATVFVSFLIGLMSAKAVGQQIVIMCSGLRCCGSLPQVGTDLGQSIIGQPIILGCVGGAFGLLLGITLAPKAFAYVRDPYWYEKEKRERKEAKEKVRREAALRLLEQGPTRVAADAWKDLATDERLSLDIRLEAANVLENLVKTGHGEEQYDIVPVSARLNQFVENSASRLARRVRFLEKLLRRYQRKSSLLEAAQRTRLRITYHYQANTQLRLEAAQGLPEPRRTKATIDAWCDEAKSHGELAIRMEAIQKLIDLDQMEAAQKALARIARDKAVDSDSRLKAINTLQQLGADELAAKLLLRLSRENA